jgi:hypothetical protein
MRCVNPDCGTVATDLTRGVLRLLEMDVPPEERVTRSEGGFPICCVPSRYFWLCAKCATFLSIRRWTADGLLLEPKVGVEMTRLPVARIPPDHRSTVRGAA